MATSTVADIYDAIKNAGGEYCCICFCVSSERKLVLPVYISQLPRFNNERDAKKGVIRICYLCEAMAAKAVRFLRAIDWARNIKAALKWMTEDVRCALASPSMDFQFKSTSIKKALAKINQMEDKIRNSSNNITQLSQSNIITVGSEVAERPGTGVRGTRSVGTGTSDVAKSVGPFSTNSGLTVSINTNDTRLADTSRSPNSIWPFLIKTINIEPVSYKDAKLEKVDPHLKLETSAVRMACEPGLMQLQVEEPKTGNMLLHPIVMGKNGKMYVPTLKVQVVNNEFIKSVSDEEILQETYLRLPPARSSPKNKTRGRNEVKSFDDVHATCNTMLDNYVHFVNQNSNKAKEVLKHQIKKARLDCENSDSSQDGRVGVTSQDGRVRVTSQDGRVGVDESVTKVASYAAAEAPTPVLRMDKVLDWEDKIPMEVISFMDATDPNPTERIMQPNVPRSSNVGVISDIRTIEDKDDSDDSEFTIANPEKIKIYVRNGTVRPVKTLNAIKTVNPVNVTPVNTYSFVESDNDVMLVENVECIDLC